MATPKHLVLLPGLLCDSALWQHQIDDLKDFCDITVMDLTRDDSIPALAERVLDEAPSSFALAGLSMGGYVAFEILRQAPERVDRLALVDTNARPDSEEQSLNRRRLLRLAEIGTFKGVTPRLLPNLVHPSRLEDPNVAGVVMEMAERVGQDAFVRQQTAVMNRSDSRPDLDAIRVPTLVLAGREDLLSPVACQEEMMKHLPFGTLIYAEVCGHLAPLERPEVVNAAFRTWLGIH